jgi:hypothetical protein
MVCPDEGVLEKRWRETRERREPEPDPYRETDAMRRRRQATEHERAWSDWFDTKFDQRIIEERNTICEIVAEALGASWARSGIGQSSATRGCSCRRRNLAQRRKCTPAARPAGALLPQACGPVNIAFPLALCAAGTSS